MRALVLLPLAMLAACPTSEPDPNFCTDFAAADTACTNEDNLAECESANLECPGEVLVMESCPVQFRCP